jgi:hypothetical protein
VARLFKRTDYEAALCVTLKVELGAIAGFIDRRRPLAEIAQELTALADRFTTSLQPNTTSPSGESWQFDPETDIG